MLVVDGSFEEHIDELATFIDSLSQEDSKVQEKVEQCLQEDDKEKAIKAVVDASRALENASEKDFESAHNLFIHILVSSDEISSHLPSVLTNLKKVPTFANGPNVSYNILTTLYHVAPSECRLPIFTATLDVCSEHDLYEIISPKFKSIPKLLKEWNASPEDSRAIYVKVAEMCESAGEPSSEYLIRAIETYKSPEGSTDLAVRALNVAFNEEERLTYGDLSVLKPITALQSEKPAHFELLSLLETGTYADFKDFAESSESFFSTNSLSLSTLETKFKLLTIASLAARQDNRKLRYSDVASALEISEAEVESWLIDTIKSGLVEGKMSQPSSLFMVHRATYRTFDHEQWEEVSAKLASWRESLQGILEVIDNVKNDVNGGQPNGFGSEADGDEARSQASDVGSVNQIAD